MKNISLLLKISSILWILWGLVHVLAGVMTMKGVLTEDIAASVIGIADAIDPATLQIDYPKASGAIIGQHGFNLFWVGSVTFICALFIWNGSKNAIYLAAISGGLTDLGYFLFIDLGGYSKFVPGSIMTIISFLAIITSLYAYYKLQKEDSVS